MMAAFQSAPLRRNDPGVKGDFTAQRCTGFWVFINACKCQGLKVDLSAEAHSMGLVSLPPPPHVSGKSLFGTPSSFGSPSCIIGLRTPVVTKEAATLRSVSG